MFKYQRAHFVSDDSDKEKGDVLANSLQDDQLEASATDIDVSQE